jgi:hypothetical protein
VRGRGAIILGLIERTQVDMERQNPTSLIIPVHEAAFVQPFRVKHLHRPGVTMPPHITVQSPFKPVGALDPQVLNTLRAVCRAYPQFSFMLARTARFVDTGVLYLVPEPPDAFLKLQRTIRTHFPSDSADHPVMHLTLAGWHPTDLDRIEEEFYREYGDRLPIVAWATEVCLFEQRVNVWMKHSTFALGENFADA